MTDDHTPAVGGDDVCWLDRMCPECGGLDEHREGCANRQDGSDVFAEPVQGLPVAREGDA